MIKLTLLSSVLILGIADRCLAQTATVHGDSALRDMVQKALEWKLDMDANDSQESKARTAALVAGGNATVRIVQEIMVFPKVLDEEDLNRIMMATTLLAKIRTPESTRVLMSWFELAGDNIENARKQSQTPAMNKEQAASFVTAARSRTVQYQVSMLSFMQDHYDADFSKMIEEHLENLEYDVAPWAAKYLLATATANERPKLIERLRLKVNSTTSPFRGHGWLEDLLNRAATMPATLPNQTRPAI